jgi:aspartyl-tRNA synthetase
MTAYGYARVSTNGQDLSSQEAELLGAGCAKVFKEKVSGAKTDRAELAKVIRRLEPGCAGFAWIVDHPLFSSLFFVLSLVAVAGVIETHWR